MNPFSRSFNGKDAVTSLSQFNEPADLIRAKEILENSQERVAEDQNRPDRADYILAGFAEELISSDILTLRYPDSPRLKPKQRKDQLLVLTDEICFRELKDLCFPDAQNTSANHSETKTVDPLELSSEESARKLLKEILEEVFQIWACDREKLEKLIEASPGDVASSDIEKLYWGAEVD